MAFAIGTSAGAEFVASELSIQEGRYDPVFDTPLDSLPIFNLLPSFYRDLMEDKEVFQGVWTGVMHVLSAELLNAWQVDYAKDLRDVPVLSQRKWLLYDFLRSEDFAETPALITKGLPARYVHDLTAGNLGCTWVTRGGEDKAVIALRGTATQDASLRWSFEVRLTSAESRGCAMVGYLSSDTRHRLVAGVVGGSNADEPFPFVGHVSETAELTSVEAGVSLDVDTDYRFDCAYTARTGLLTLSVVELGATKLTGTAGETAEDDDGDTYTNQFSDESVNFDEVGIVVGDVLVIEEQEYEIAEVAGSLLVTVLPNLPAEASGLTYEIRGESELASISLELNSEATDPTFSVNEFGTVNLDIRFANNIVTSATGNRKEVVGILDNWTFLDPSTQQVVLDVPRLQDGIKEVSAYLFRGTDYEIEGSTFLFQEPPDRTYWAEYSAYDEEYIKDNFGTNVELEDASSDTYKARVRGLYYAFFRGPTVNAIRTGVNILVGLPIADAAGEVESINPAYSGTFGQIVVSGRSYLYPLSAGTFLSVGDEVEAFQPLAKGVDVLDYINTRRWWLNVSDPELIGRFAEIRRYHSFAISLNLDAFDLDTLSLAATFVNTIKPTWKDAYFIVHKDLDDAVEVDDDLVLAVGASLWDTICGGVLPRYDSVDYEGDAPDWIYDQGWTEPTNFDVISTGAAMRATGTALTGTATIDLSGSRVVDGVGTSFTTEVGSGLVGTTTDTGTAGSTNAAGDEFTGDGTEDFLTSLSATAGDPPPLVTHLEIVGVGVARVTEVVSATVLKFTPLFSSELPNFQSLSGVSYNVATAAYHLMLGRYFSGTAGETSAGSQTLVDASAPFDGVAVGDRVVISGETDEFEVQAVVSTSELTLDRDTDNTTSTASWEVFGKLTYWNPIAYVVDDTELWLSQEASSSFLGVTDVHLSLIDNDYLFVRYDQFLEACPDEELTFIAELSTGYQEILLTASSPARLTWTVSSFGVTAQPGAHFITELGTEVAQGANGSTDSATPITFTALGQTFLSDIPNSGAGTPPTEHTRLLIVGVGIAVVTLVVDDENLELDPTTDTAFQGLSGQTFKVHIAGSVTDTFVSTPDGAWSEVSNVIDDENLQLTSAAHDSFSDVLGYRAREVLLGTFTFSNGSPTVTATVSQTGQISPGDWIQVVPTQDFGDPVGSTPVVEVSAIDGAGTTITLSSNYSGQNASGVQVARRGDSSVLPLAISLPTGTQNFTDWFGTSGGTLSSTVPEPS